MSQQIGFGEKENYGFDQNILSREKRVRILGNRFKRNPFPRVGPLGKLWGVRVGNFRAAGIFFRHQISRMNFFRP